MKTIFNAILFSMLLSAASSSFAQEGWYDGRDQVSDSDVIVDLFLARPLGIVGSAAGIVIHGVGLLFSVPGENFDEVAEVMVEDPLNYTFNRPLGRFED